MTAQRIALITGSGKGIGQGIAMRLARDGFCAAVNDINERGAADTVREIREAGGVAQAFPADIGDSRQVEALVAQVEEQLGGIRVLVNNAGIATVSSVVDLDEGEWDRIFRVNLRATFLCCKAVARRMVARAEPGRIINIASELGKRGQAYISHYCASKAGVITFTQSLAMELAPNNITVNSVCPTMVDTDLMNEFADDFAKLKGGTRQQWRDTFREMVPLGRMGTPADVAAVVAFLASQDAEFVTGASYNVTGGKEVN